MPALLAHAEQRQDILRALVRTGVPTTTAYVRAAAPEAGPGDLDLRWAALEHSLVAQHATDEDIAALRAVATTQPPGDHALAAFVADGHVRLLARLDEYDGVDVVAHGWPHALPLLRWEQRMVPVVVAVVGHGNAHLSAYDDDGVEVVTEEIVGADDEIERNFPGGWSQPRYQRRAVDSWSHNARQFAASLTHLARGVEAGLVLVAGDRREAVLVAEALPTELRDLVVTDVTARPASDGYRHVAPADRMAAVRAAARGRLVRRLASFDDAVGRLRAVEGPADVRAALDQGRVEQLIVVDGAATDELSDALVAAALDAGTEIVVADRGDIELVGGVGAMLRFA